MREVVRCRTHDDDGGEHHDADELRGWVRRALIDDQLNVPTDTMIMIATKRRHRDLLHPIASHHEHEQRRYRRRRSRADRGHRTSR